MPRTCRWEWMPQMYGLSKTRTPIDTCEKGWYLIDSDHALPPIARQNKRQVADCNRHEIFKTQKENASQCGKARSPGFVWGRPAG